MRRLLPLTAPLLLPLLLAPASAQPTAEPVPAGLQCLLAAYPDHLCSATATTLTWCDGTTMVWDDGVARTFDQQLDAADLEDQMSQRYTPGRAYTVPIPEDHDPGRIRHAPFFTKMYGATQAEARARLAPVRWLPSSVNTTLQVTSINGVDRELQAVSDELDKLPRAITDLVAKTSGTFVWRTVKGTDRRSLHSFGVAIDVGVAVSDYWKWRNPVDGKYPYRNRIPLEVVEVFERHGFVWGGKWYHFDTMHFEYRPELLQASCTSTP